MNNFNQIPWWSGQMTVIPQYQQFPTTTTTSNITYTSLFDYQKMVDYMDFAFKLLGIDMTYDKFILLTEAEKKAFLRDIKISRLIN